MNLIRKILLSICVIFLTNCVNNTIDKSLQIPEKKYYSSTGFALIYEKSFYENGNINKKLDNEKVGVMHSFLKRNTYIKIINPENSKFIETKVINKANYPKIFNIVISKKISTMLNLDPENPYVEILEVKKNKTFIAKETDIFEEEKYVAEKVIIKQIEMDDLSKESYDNSKKLTKKKNFILLITDFYHIDSANNLKNELIKKTKENIFSVKKLSNNKYRLTAGPFNNFNALKSIYISLNNLGFEDLNIYKE